MSGIDSGERLLTCGDSYGHVWSGMDGAHGGFGFGKRNVEDEMILEFADALNQAVLNTWFKRRRGDCLHMSPANAGMWLITSILSRKVKGKLSGVLRWLK